MIKSAYMVVAEIRRDNLRALAAQAGSPAKLAKKLGMTDSQMGQLIGRKPRKNIGNRLARKIESILAKQGFKEIELGWLDQAHAISMATDIQETLIKAIKLSDKGLESEGIDMPSEKRALLYMEVFKRLQAGNLDLGEIRGLIRYGMAA